VGRFSPSVAGRRRSRVPSFRAPRSWRSPRGGCQNALSSPCKSTLSCVAAMHRWWPLRVNLRRQVSRLRRRNLLRYRTWAGLPSAWHHASEFSSFGCLGENRRFDRHSLGWSDAKQPHTQSCTPKTMCTMRCTSPNRFASRS